MAVRKNEKSFIFQGYIFILFLYTFAEKDNSGQKIEINGKRILVKNMHTKLNIHCLKIKAWPPHLKLSCKIANQRKKKKNSCRRS